MANKQERSAKQKHRSILGAPTREVRRKKRTRWTKNELDRRSEEAQKAITFILLEPMGFSKGAVVGGHIGCDERMRRFIIKEKDKARERLASHASPVRSRAHTTEVANA